MKRNFTVTLSLPTAVSTILLSYVMAVPMEGTHAKSVAHKCVLVTVNSTGKWLSDGLELVFGNLTQDFKRAQRLCKLHNATLPYEGMVDSIRPCLWLGNTYRNGYYWIQTYPDVSTRKVFNVTNTKNVDDEEYHNYVCVIAKDIKTHLTIQAEGQSNTTYSNTGTKNTFQAWTGQKLNLSCESDLKNVLSRLCIKNAVSNETCETSNSTTWTPDNCENNITVTCESLHCLEDIDPAGKTDVSIKVQCPLEILSFTSNSRHDTGGTHMYNMGDEVTFTCITKGSTNVTIVKIQGMKMEETVVSGYYTYSITNFSCDDMGTYYCIAKQGDSQVNRSLNVTVSGSCPPKLCSEETQEEGSLDNETVGHPVSVCIIASGLSNLVTFNGQHVHCDGEMSSPPWQCSIERIDQIFMTYNFTFIIQDDSLLVDKKVTIGLETEKPGGELNLTYTLDTDRRRVITTTPQTSAYNTNEGLSLSQAVIISIVLIVIVLIIACFILGVLYRKMKGKHQSYSYHMPFSSMSNRNGHVNRGSENTDDLELHSSVHVGLHLSCPNPIHERQDSQDSEESQNTPWRSVEEEPNANLYQNLSEAKCTSTMGVYANLSDFRDTSGPSQRLATNAALKAKGQNSYHPMTPVSSSPTAGSYVSQEGLVYITVDHSVSSGNTRSALDRQRGFNERDSIQYARLDFTNTGKYDIRRDKMKLKRLKHERHN